MKMLYVAPLNFGSTAGHRLQALRDLGHAVTSLDTAPEWLIKQSKRLFHRGWNKIFNPRDWLKINQQIVEAVQQSHFDLLWLDKVLEIKPETLIKIRDISPDTKTVYYMSDDIRHKYNRPPNFIKCLPYVHTFVATREVNVPELRELGCHRVIVTGFAYDPQAHRPLPMSEEERRRWGGAVGFIGSYEAERAQSILYLARQGVPVYIRGYGWQAQSHFRHPNMIFLGPSVLGDDYARALCSCDIALGFLRKKNRDTQTTRTYEIPACGVFMLAERSADHLRLFEEGREAEFFASDAELLEKVRYYLKHEDERRRIAQAGRARCLTSGYSNQGRLREILDRVNAEA